MVATVVGLKRILSKKGVNYQVISVLYDDKETLGHAVKEVWNDGEPLANDVVGEEVNVMINFQGRAFGVERV